jgi:DNA-binding winged helix-turn-helix (wHTH) protein
MMRRSRRLRFILCGARGAVELHFGEFVLDTDSRQVRRGSKEIHLSPKAYALLVELIEQRPNALSKAVLQERLWPGTFVVEANLSNLVAEIRDALGDAARQPRFIRTVHGFGYAFCGTVVDASAPIAKTDVTCVLIRNGRLWHLVDGENVLGREGERASWFDSTSVSRRHARIVVADGRAMIEDLSSKNGTFVGDERVRTPVPLTDGDQIRLGSFRVTFRFRRPQPSTETHFGD